jgi:hypothetical protein
MSESYSLPTEPEGIVASLLERFNSGKVSAMMGLYAPEAVFIAKDGRTITDHKSSTRPALRCISRPARHTARTLLRMDVGFSSSGRNAPRRKPPTSATSHS